jgi:tetratricopeptide (TPR) repeat protein
MFTVARCSTGSLALLVLAAWVFCPVRSAADTLPAAEEMAGAVVAGTDPGLVAAKRDEHVVEDEGLLNAVRLLLKDKGRAEDARRLLSALAERRRSDAVLYNLSLAYIDQLPGHNLLNKGHLSTESVRVVDEILQHRPGDWLAFHIRGMNNLYWPDWFNRAPTSRADFGRAVEAGRSRLAERPEEDGLAWSYLGLGDALALMDQPAEARAAWAEGAWAYPYFPALADRLALGDAVQHARVREERDSDKPIDTDLKRLESSSDRGHGWDLVGGTLYGPGPLEDQPLPKGRLNNLLLARPVTGAIPEMNNGTAEPHLPGEIAVGKAPDGRFSDGTPVNKNIDVGHVVLMNGKFKLFLAALDGGPNHGVVHFYLDRFWNWTIQDDIGIDPGFPVGIIKFQNFTFSTSPRLLPASTQTQNKEPAGVDRAGSLTSGAVVPGLLGDDDEDGKLDGTVNAIGSFPLDSVILPGAPFAQTRVFRSDVPVSPEVAGFLTLANAVSHLRAAAAYDAEGASAKGGIGNRLEDLFRERLGLAMRHFSKADSWVRSLDPEAGTAYARLTTPPRSFDGPAARTGFVCAADGDLAILAARLGLVRRETDASRLADLQKCGAS